MLVRLAVALRASALFAAALIIATPSAHAGSVTFTQVGSPTWKLVNGELFSAPIGTAADGYVEFLVTEGTILPAPDHQVLNGQIVPGAPHTVTGHEMSDGITNAGFKRGPKFVSSDFSNGKGIWVGFTAVPSSAAPTGKSPDFNSGPIVPNGIFPINQTGATLRNGQLFDGNWNASTPDVNTVLSLSPPQYDGYSDVLFFNAESIDFGPANTASSGDYTSTWTDLDASGAGWKIQASYTVASAAKSVPLPPAVLLAIPGLLAVAAGCYLQRRRFAK